MPADAPVGCSAPAARNWGAAASGPLRGCARRPAVRRGCATALHQPAFGCTNTHQLLPNPDMSTPQLRNITHCCKCAKPSTCRRPYQAITTAMPTSTMETWALLLSSTTTSTSVRPTQLISHTCRSTPLRQAHTPAACMLRAEPHGAAHVIVHNPLPALLACRQGRTPWRRVRHA